MSISQVSSGGVSQLCQSVKSSAPSKEADIITLTYQEIMTNLIGDKFFKEEDSFDYGCFDRGEQGRDVRGRNRALQFVLRIMLTSLRKARSFARQFCAEEIAFHSHKGAPKMVYILKNNETEHLGSQPEAREHNCYIARGLDLAVRRDLVFSSQVCVVVP